MIAWSPNDDDIAIANNNNPRLHVYPWASGFGTKYSNPDTIPTGDCNAVDFHPDGNVIAVAHDVSPYVSAYPWTHNASGGSNDGFGTKYSNPSTLPSNTGEGIAFSPDGNDIAVAHASSPYISVYPWSSGFGTKYSNPSTLPPNLGKGVAFSPDGTDIAVCHLDSPYVSVYPWTSGTGFGTKYSNPSTLPPADAANVAFSPAYSH